VQQQLDGDVEGARRTEAEFKRRFGLERIPVDREYVQSQIRQRNVPRTERILDRLPPQLRASYGLQVQQAKPEGFNVPEGMLGRVTSRMQQREMVDEPLPGSNPAFAPFAPY
jgi:hypothetical protein